METKTGSCHCGAVVFEIDLEDGLKDLKRCNCSLCRRKGYIMAGVPLNRLRILRGEENLSLYRWNTGVARHYFCKTCGIYTHHQRRSRPDTYGVNIGCLEGVDAYAGGDVPVANGAALSGDAGPPPK